MSPSTHLDFIILILLTLADVVVMYTNHLAGLLGEWLLVIAGG